MPPNEVKEALNRLKNQDDLLEDDRDDLEPMTRKDFEEKGMEIHMKRLLEPTPDIN